ncbi:hypothetical protein [Tepidiphilus margaritifer]|uniref:hypothetical protein n=1 Tax=Tepidiphilus margaritifer TaxID=203471 RepID=UPI000402D461|nr:hypothetical protein [Tepidiphilus margaritifer]
MKTPYRLTYLATIALVLGGHLYFSFTHDVSPLTPLLLLLLLMPFAPYGWAQIAKIGISHQGVVIERIKNEVRETFERVCMDRSIAPHAIDDLFTTTENNEWMTLILARMLMRYGLGRLLREQAGDLHHDDPALANAIRRCYEHRIISEAERESLEKLRRITYYAEWWQGTPPTYEEWDWAIENAKSIIRALLSKQKITR